MNYRSLMVLTVTCKFFAGTLSAASAATVGYWQLQDGMPTTNVSTATSTVNNGTLQGTGTGNPVYNSDVPHAFIRDGIGGPIVNASNSASVAFSGSNFIQTGFNSLLESSDFTIEFFAKRPSIETFPGIVTKSDTATGTGHTGPTSWGLGENNAGQIFYRVDTTTSNNVSNSLAVVMSNNAWHHYALTHNGSTGLTSLYLDYVNTASFGTPGSLAYDGSSGLRIALMALGGSFNSFSGLVDEVRYSNSVLLPTQFLVPEPSSIALLGLGVIGLVRIAGRRRT